MSNSTRGLILITGANGFIGSWVCKTSLDSGYSVRAVVRTSAKGDALRELFRAHSAKLEIAIVADQTAVSPINFTAPSLLNLYHSLVLSMRRSRGPSLELFIQ